MTASKWATVVGMGGFAWWLITRKKQPPKGEVYLGPVQVLTAKEAGMTPPTAAETESLRIATYIRQAVRLDLDEMAPTIKITPARFAELSALVDKLPRESQEFYRDIITQARDRPADT